MSSDNNTPAETAPLKAPSTEAPDGSALVLQGAGQTYITTGWTLAIIVFIIFLCIGISVDEGFECLCVLAFAGICAGGLFLAWGYSNGAKAKATAVAAINAKKAAERSARMEQMLVNMVDGNENVAVAPAAAQKDCPKCGAKIPANTKFCPECGAPTTAVCAKCGATLTVGAKFCAVCGAKCE